MASEKITDAGAFSKMRDDAHPVLDGLSREAQAKMNAMGSLVAVMNMVEDIHKDIEEMRAYVAGRERLGEYDASAQAIIELAQRQLKMMELIAVAMRGIVNFRVER
jgi:hypothetical protein